jgi:uncharacterized protein YukE
MTTLHFVKKARKTIRGTGIRRGDSYYWWKFAYGEKQVSKTKPRRSQLTRSEYYSTIFDIEDALADLKPEAGMEAEVQQAIEELRQLGEDCQGKHDNMPDSLQEGETGQLLQERADSCEQAAEELESIDFDIENKGDDETEEEFWQSKLDEIQAVSLDNT